MQDLNRQFPLSLPLTAQKLIRPPVISVQMFPGSQLITIVSTCDTILQLGKNALSTGDENDISPFPSTQLNDL